MDFVKLLKHKLRLLSKIIYFSSIVKTKPDMKFLTFSTIALSFLISCTEKPSKKATGEITTTPAPATTASAPTAVPPPPAATPAAEPAAAHAPTKGTTVNPASLNLAGKWSVAQYYGEKEAKAFLGKAVLNITADKIIRQFGAKADTCTYASAEKIEQTFTAFLEGSNVKVAGATPNITAVRLTGAGGECLGLGLFNKSILVWEDGGLFELQKK
ncbi:MAG: hypothetical protein RLZZ628_2619 [Bacteroidota bacterium]|jgi:hypothetical protein